MHDNALPSGLDVCKGRPGYADLRSQLPLSKLQPFPSAANQAANRFVDLFWAHPLLISHTVQNVNEKHNVIDLVIL